MSLRRRLRGVIGTALFWSVIWLPIGAILLSWPVRQPTDVVYTSSLVDLVFFPVFGFLSGSFFSLLVSWTERNRSLDDLSLARVAAWGAIGCVIIPLLFVIIDFRRSMDFRYDWTFALAFLGVCAGLGALCAALTLALARRPTRT